MAEIISSIGLVTVILLCLGVVFALCELFTAGFGVFALCSVISVVGSIVAMAIHGATFTNILIISLITIIFFLMVFIIFTKSAKNGLLSKTALFENGQAVPQYKSKENDKFKNLVGKCGEASSLCKPAGLVVIDEEEYSCTAIHGLIEKGDKIIVVGYTTDDLVVDKMEENEDVE